MTFPAIAFMGRGYYRVPPTERLKAQNAEYRKNAAGNGADTLTRGNATAGGWNDLAESNWYLSYNNGIHQTTYYNYYWFNDTDGIEFEEDTTIFVALMTVDAGGEESRILSAFNADSRDDLSQLDAQFKVWLMRDGYKNTYDWNAPPVRTGDVYTILDIDVWDSMVSAHFQETTPFIKTTYQILYRTIAVTIPAGTTCGGIECGVELQWNKTAGGAFRTQVFYYRTGSAAGQGSADGPWKRTLVAPAAYEKYGILAKQRPPWWEGTKVADFWP